MKKIDNINTINESKTNSNNKTKSNTQYIGVNFNSTSKKYQGKTYYYKTDKSVSTGDKIIVNTLRNDKTKAIVTKTDIKHKPTNKKLRTF